MLRYGQLMWKKEIEKKYGTLEVDTDGRVSFVAKVKSKGVSADLHVRVFVFVFEEELVQLWDYKVEYTTVPLGEKRMEALCEALRKQFYEDEDLFAPIKHKAFYAFGKHYAFAEHYHTRSVLILKKRKSTDFELLASETAKTEGKEIVYRYFYEERTQQLIEHIENSTWEEKWKMGEVNQVLYDLQWYARPETQMIIDEKERIYQVRPVPDPENIRVFILKRKEREKFIQTIAGLHKSAEKFTYQEAMQSKALYEDKKYPSFSGLLPFVDKTVTIYSSRVIGKKISDYPIGTWVKTKDGKIGVTTSKRTGHSYEVCLEKDYLPDWAQIAHNVLDSIPNPCQPFDTPPLVHYHLKLPRKTYYGFGYLVEERPSVCKIKPISRYEKNTASLLQAMVIDDLRFHRRKQEETITKIKAIHGDDLDFLLVPKEHVKRLSEVEEKACHAFLKRTTALPEEQVVENLFTLQKVEQMNWDYVLFYLLSFNTFESMTDLLRKLTALMLQHGTENLAHVCAEWFQKLEVKKRIKLSS